ncbi:glycoside hydrolase [Russula earlei]|uniref:Glycoside hydrolase n=1 Tax=Russula earlei TaxID=71964 RepID=A0ACC0UCR3_9AGAM|nr:glycoside hydrolase [Russula earlei]
MVYSISLALRLLGNFSHLELRTPTMCHAVGRLPALGWNTWNAYRCEISEERVLTAAKTFVSLGLKEAGYEYVNIDDCWSLLERDPVTNEQVPDPAKFPRGIKAVANDIHSMGLKIGIYRQILSAVGIFWYSYREYSDAGTETCAGYPGSLGYEAVDAATWQSWDIDYLKYDNCNVPTNWSDASIPPGGDWYNSNSAIRFREMGTAIANNDPPMQYSLCIWGEAHVWTWGARVGHSWRMAGDSSPTWEYIKSIIKHNVNHLSSVDFFAHNDMDMMEIGNGNGNLTMEEERTHFAVWAFMKSPILLGTELAKLTPEEVKIVTNAELIAFHQDTTVGKPAMPYIHSTDAAPAMDPPQFYSGESSRGIHVFVVNTNDTSLTFTINFTDVPGLSSVSARVHDMWTSTDLGEFPNNYNVTLAAHDTAALLVTPLWADE